MRVSNHISQILYRGANTQYMRDVSQRVRYLSTFIFYTSLKSSQAVELTQLVSVRRYAVSYTFNQLIITIQRLR